MEDNDDKIVSHQRAIQTIAVLSLAHMGIDFICAFSLYHSFAKLPQVFLLYNFCAFALQMPIGMIVDRFSEKYHERYIPALICTVSGIVLTCLGAFLSPLITGLGNAMFHTGAGIVTINEDDENGFKGKGLGAFVAPGALGLILGSLFNDTIYYLSILIIVEVIFAGIILWLYLNVKSDRHDITLCMPKGIYTKIGICFVVVVLRSLCGMAIAYPWKVGNLLTIVSVIALAAGKCAGGFLSASFGYKKTVIFSLGLAALAFVLGERKIFGLLALFLFNMTMPLTLYLLAKEMKSTPGMAFGILTFGLFIGYLPVLYGLIYKVSPVFLGPIACLISMFLLLKVKEGKDV